MSDSDASADTVGKRSTGILDRVTDIVIALDTDWEVTYVNGRAATVLGQSAGESVTPQELMGRGFWDIVPEAVDTPFYEHYHEAMETGEAVSFDEYYDPLDRWFAVRAYPSETGLTILAYDVTDEREHRDELVEREAVLREIYASIADQDSTFDSQVEELLRIGTDVLDVNYGTLSRVEGEDYIFEIVHAPEGTIEAGDVVDLDATNCERVVATERRLAVADLERDAPELTEKAGFIEWGISCYLGAPVMVDGDPYGTFCFYDTEPRSEPFNDWEVTLVDLLARWVSTALERKLTQQELLEQNERLEQFASMVSHDLRSPLSVAQGWTEVAREEDDSEALEKVSDAHDRMETLIEDILSLARAGRAVDTVERVELAEVCERAWESMPSAEATLEVAEEIVVPADRSRLQQLFENLFRNSVEHGGTAVTVRVGALDDGFYVADDGPGIPPEERDRVFEFGYSTSEEGTGQGLSIVKQIAEAHGWSVAVSKSSEGGARFEFEGVK